MQYATQTVTVTDRDAKALGQPVGSTTTVLLTAYPSGHGPPSGPPAAATSSQQQLFPPASSSSSTAQLAQASAVSTAPSVQVSMVSSPVCTSLSLSLSLTRLCIVPLMSVSSLTPSCLVLDHLVYLRTSTLRPMLSRQRLKPWILQSLIPLTTSPRLKSWWQLLL